MSIKFNVKEIDFKSFLIGFLLAAVVFLSLGSSSGTQDVRIVGVSMSSYDHIPVKIEDIKSNVEFPVKLVDVKYSLEVPVKIKN